MHLKDWVSGCGMDLTGPGQSPVVDSCEHDNDP